MKINPRGYVLLSMQRALLKAVTPELRAVTVNIEEKELLYIRFYYSGEGSDKLIDLYECAITETVAHLPDSDLDSEVVRLDYPIKMPFRGWLAYLRKEPYQPATIKFSPPCTHVAREIVNFEEKCGVFINPVTEEKVDTNFGIVYFEGNSRHIIPAKPENYKITITPLSYVMLSLQKALLGRVTPELRAVFADLIEPDKIFHIRFCYDGEISEEILEDWKRAIAESYADLGHEFTLDAKIEKIPFPEKIVARGRYAYFRSE